MGQFYSATNEFYYIKKYFSTHFNVFKNPPIIFTPALPMFNNILRKVKLDRNMSQLRQIVKNVILTLVLLLVLFV
jgi:hypothetical protein